MASRLLTHAGHASGACTAPASPGGLDHTPAGHPDLREGLSESCRSVLYCCLSGLHLARLCQASFKKSSRSKKHMHVLYPVADLKEHDAEEPTVLSVERPGNDSAAAPKRAPRQRGLWGAAARSDTASARQVAPESLQREDALESEQAACRGTSLVGSGISMSALSSAFQVREPPLMPFKLHSAPWTA